MARQPPSPDGKGAKTLRIVAGKTHTPAQGDTSPRARGKRAARAEAKAAREAKQRAKAEADRQRIRVQWGLDDLDEIDKALLAHKLTTPAIEHTALAALMGLGRETVSRRVNRPAFKKALDESTLTALSILAAAQLDGHPEAVGVKAEGKR